MNDLSRGRRNPVSKIAFQKVKESADVMRHRIFNLINGVKSTRQICEELGKLPHEISGRFTELKAANKIYLKTKTLYNGKLYSVYEKTE